MLMNAILQKSCAASTYKMFSFASPSSQREAVGVIDRVITANGKPYHYLLKNLNDRAIRYKFSAADLKPAPALEDIKLTVNQILETRAGKCKVSFYGYPR